MTDTTRHDGRPGADTTPTRRVTVKEAAALLDVTPDAIRARLRRGTLRKETGPDGETLVLLKGAVSDGDGRRHDADTTTDTMRPVGDAMRHDADTTALVEQLRGEIKYLRETIDKRDDELSRRDDELRRRDEELRRRDEELRRRDHQLWAALERVPPAAIEPPEPREAPVSSSEETDKDKASSEQQGPSQRRSWLRAFFGLSQ